MRKVVAAQFVSLDGVVEAADKWTFKFMDAEVGQELGSQMAERDTMLLGRRTYEEFAAVWPGRGTEDPIGAGMNNTPKYVVSTTLTDVDQWQNSTLVKGGVVEQINELKQQPGKDIAIIGSATLIRSLLRDGAIDELQLMLYPVVVGNGKRLFDDHGGQQSLSLIESRVFETGVIKLVYAPAGK